MRIEKYSDQYKQEWDQFISDSKNGHFMFQRDYMEYHSDRFQDYSLLAFNEKNQLCAVLPASIKNKEIISHQGLSFGGYVYQNKLKTVDLLAVHETIIDFLMDAGLDKFVYKAIPYIYADNPTDEDLYILFKKGFNLYRRDISSTIDLTNEILYSSRKKRSIKKAHKSPLTYREASDFSNYWHVLSTVLAKEHGTKPVHTIDEIHHLKNKFPNNIKLYEALIGDEVVAGTVLFISKGVTHTQYLAVNELGRQHAALDGLIDYLIQNNFYNSRYFDFGISTEDGGKTLNNGLVTHKEEYGAHGVIHDFYEINLHP